MKILNAIYILIVVCMLRANGKNAWRINDNLYVENGNEISVYQKVRWNA